MRLFYSLTSPYVRKVRVVAHETGLASSIEEVLCNPFDDPPELRQLNPLGKVPTLVCDDGSALFDSRVICAYLGDRADKASLIPKDPAQRWAVLRAQALADGLLDSAVALTMEGRRPEGERSPATMARWRGAIQRAVECMAGDWEALPGAVTLGHIAYACALGYLDFRHPELAWRDGRPGLAQWFAEFDARPSMTATRPSVMVS